MRRSQGFSLIELMVVVAIVAILAAVAIPNYRRYVVRTHRTDARRTLLDLAGRQERYFYSNNTYAANLTDLSSDTTTSGGLYQLSGSGSATDFTLTATAQGSQQADDPDCQTLSINRAGQQTSTGTTDNAPQCWNE